MTTLRQASRGELMDALVATRDSTLTVLDTLMPAQLDVPYRAEINPLRWELGHIAWFHELWCLRWADGLPSKDAMLQGADRWFDSSRVAHPTRWRLPLPPLAQLRSYLVDVRDAALERLSRADEDDAGLYPHRLALFHEQMHLEAFDQTCQTMGWPSLVASRKPLEAVPADADASLAGGPWMLGAKPGDGFVFDNEKWAHPVDVAPFTIAMQPVTNADFVDFVADGGYLEPRWWDPPAFESLHRAGRTMPASWQRTDGRWTQRWFGERVPLEPGAPVVQVDAHEAEAWCRWAGRRLPTEVEWEHAATHCDDFRWGSHVWEWTATTFDRYPGFSADRYVDYSVPWFGTHRVLRGGSFATPRALLSPRFRNFHLPQRRDVFAGFRTCAIR